MFVLPVRFCVLPLLCTIAACLLGLSTPVRGQADLSSDLEAIRAKYHLPGLSAMAIKEGHIVAQGAAGVRRVGNPAPLLVSDPVNIGSCTKWMTATIAGRLVDRGTISWNTKVRDVFPEVAFFDAAFSDATLDQILSHLAGIQQGSTFESCHWAQLQAQLGTIQEIRRWVCDTVLTEAPEVTPGTFLYSNQGYDVAATMLEIASGKSWETLIQEEVFAPASMTALLGQVDDGSVPPLAPAGHDLAEGAATATPRTIMDAATLLHYQASNAPGGFVGCSLQNWAKFLNLHTASGSGSYLSAATATHLQTAAAGSGAQGYSRGVYAVNRNWALPGQALNHSGDIFGQDSVFWMAPAKNFVAVVFTNCRSSDGSVTANGMDEVAALLVTRYTDAAASGPLLSSPPPNSSPVGNPIADVAPVASVSVSVAKTKVGSGVPGLVTLTLSSPAKEKLKVKYLLGGNAAKGADYQALSGNAKFKPGQNSVAVQIVGQGNLGGAGKKTLTLTLQPGKGYSVGTDAKAKVKIVGE